MASKWAVLVGQGFEFIIAGLPDAWLLPTLTIDRQRLDPMRRAYTNKALSGQCGAASIEPFDR